MRQLSFDGDSDAEGGGGTAFASIREPVTHVSDHHGKDRILESRSRHRDRSFDLPAIAWIDSDSRLGASGRPIDEHALHLRLLGRSCREQPGRNPDVASSHRAGIADGHLELDYCLILADAGPDRADLEVDPGPSLFGGRGNRSSHGRLGFGLWLSGVDWFFVALVSLVREAAATAAADEEGEQPKSGKRRKPCEQFGPDTIVVLGGFGGSRWVGR
jgi:hypothetical protein